MQSVAPPSRWYYARDAQKYGPFPLEELRRLAATGLLRRSDMVLQEASTKWLALLDSGKTGAAWDVSSPHLKSVVTRKGWIDGITSARKPFGDFVKRTPTKFARSHSMPGAPDGDYSIIEFDTEFANGKRASEHIIWMLGEREVWSVSGYYIR